MVLKPKARFELEVSLFTGMTTCFGGVPVSGSSFARPSSPTGPNEEAT